jgi:hypothetical protein
VQDARKIWRTYAIFRRYVGGRGTPFDCAPLPADLAAQPGFIELTRAYEVIDREATHLGSVHRSHQVIILSLTLLASLTGALPSVWPELKVLIVAFELIVTLSVLAVWLDAQRQGRHHQWGESRRRAEELRLERAAWSLGVSLATPGEEKIRRSHAREIRRRAGLPVGRFTPERVHAWGRWAMDDLVAGQVAYHHNQTKINGHIAHRVHQVENLSFSALLILLGAFLVVSLVTGYAGSHLPVWFKAIVTVVGAFAPAVGAANIALEATLSLSEDAQRSRVLAARLESLGAEVPADAGLERLQSVARQAIRLQRRQEDHWSEETLRRRMVR